ncbi:MAG: cyclodeaminase/cyclohydrolase family protein [Atribacterota bacterium]
MIKDQKIKKFMDTLASKSATPGGGSVAALTGAMGSALVSMVGNLTLGKEKYQEVEDDIKNILKKSEKLRNELENLAERDVEVFNQFMATLKLPKETKEQKKERKEKMQIALFEAANVPLEVARKCQELLDICQEIAEKGNKNVISDAGVGAILAQAAFDSAILNVKVNLPMIRDERIKEELNTEIKNLTILTKEKKEEIVKIVLAKIE